MTCSWLSCLGRDNRGIEIPSKGQVHKDRRLWIYDMLATIYWHLEISRIHQFNNPAGRPDPILARNTPIRELL